jgi:ZIP family zinc transporter
MPEILNAAWWGGVAAAALLLGAGIAMLVRLPGRLLGLVLAFGAGVLMSTVAYELVEDALRAELGSPLVAFGFASGAIVFYTGSVALAGRHGRGRGRAQDAGRDDGAQAGGTQIVLGAVLDGIPESVVLGASLVGGAGISVPVLAAVLISNVPEGIGASADMLAAGRSRRSIARIWLVVVGASAAAAGLGYALLRDAPQELVASAQTFAAGAIIAMLAESMIPEAYQQGGRAVGLATAFGFAVSALLSFST